MIYTFSILKRYRFGVRTESTHPIKNKSWMENLSLCIKVNKFSRCGWNERTYHLMEQFLVEFNGFKVCNENLFNKLLTSVKVVCFYRILELTLFDESMRFKNFLIGSLSCKITQRSSTTHIDEKIRSFIVSKLISICRWRIMIYR